jgi:hypothetical protein
VLFADVDDLVSQRAYLFVVHIFFEHEDSSPDQNSFFKRDCSFAAIEVDFERGGDLG